MYDNSLAALNAEVGDLLTERLGAETVVEVGLNDGSRVIAAFGEDRILAPGTEIGLAFDPRQAHLFAEGDRP